jgi:putative spermidine/putrescine transport system permease protein
MLLAAFLVWPLLLLVARSIEVEGGLSLRLYAELLREPRNLEAFGNTALLAICSTLIALLLCTPAAIYIEGRPTPARRGLAVALTLPLSLPGIVIGFFVIILLGRTGVVTDVIRALTGAPNPQLAYTFWGLLLGYVYFQIPRIVLVVRGAVQNVSADAIDAARTLGATPFRVYVHVILPALRPALANAASLSLATAFGAFGTAATLNRGIRVVPLDIAALFTERFEPERAAALSLLLALVTLVSLLGIGRLAERRRAT